MRQTVRTDHGWPEFQNALNIRFVHFEVNRPCRTQACDGFFSTDAELLGNGIEVLPRELG